MATIRKKGNSYSVQIRKKNYQATATFGDRETAELWAKYKEEIYDEMPAFDPPLVEMFTLREAIELKVKNLQENEAVKKTIQDTYNLQTYFDVLCDKPLCDITLEDYSNQCKRMLNTIVKRGGYAGKGKPVQQSIMTVHRKFRYLSIVYSLMMEQGVKLINYPLTIVHELEKKAKPVISEEQMGNALQKLSDSLGI